MKKSNPDHSNDIARLNRILGQVEGIKKMIEDKRYCVDILTQTKAVGSAIKGLEASILERHLQHCVSSAIEAKNKNESQKKIEELLDLFTKRL
ncbi:MAG: metal-sensitive transcriptional regulator [Bdellovibrionales bacterium]|nr:metal-sensitive transcriptional regulator [Bdellovibrionales bacterium]